MLPRLIEIIYHLCPDFPYFILPYVTRLYLLETEKEQEQEGRSIQDMEGVDQDRTGMGNREGTARTKLLVGKVHKYRKEGS